MFGWETFRLINTFAMVEIIGNFFKFSIILMYDVKTRQLLSVQTKEEQTNTKLSHVAIRGRRLCFHVGLSLVYSTILYIVMLYYFYYYVF